MWSLLKPLMWACLSRRQCSQFTCMCLYKFILNSEITSCKLWLKHISVSLGTCKYKYLQCSSHHCCISVPMTSPLQDSSHFIPYIPSLMCVNPGPCGATWSEWHFLHFFFVCWDGLETLHPSFYVSIASSYLLHLNLHRPEALRMGLDTGSSIVVDIYVHGTNL